MPNFWHLCSFVFDQYISINKLQNEMFMKLRDWILIKKLNWGFLSKNPNAIDLLRENPQKIDWNLLNKNY